MIARRGGARKADRDERISTRCHNGEHAQCWSALRIAALGMMPPCECDCHTPCAPAACPPVEEIVVTGFTRVFDCGHAHGSPTAECNTERCVDTYCDHKQEGINR